MRIDGELYRLAFRQQIVDRAATIAGVFTTSVRGVMLASEMIGRCDSAEGPSVAGWSEREAATPIWTNRALAQRARQATRQRDLRRPRLNT